DRAGDRPGIGIRRLRIGDPALEPARIAVAFADIGIGRGEIGIGAVEVIIFVEVAGVFGADGEGQFRHLDAGGVGVGGLGLAERRCAVREIYRVAGVLRRRG